MPQLSLDQAYQLAVENHRGGRLAPAAELLRQILAQQPDHANAMHLLAVTASQLGDSAGAEVLFRRSIALRPHEGGFHYNFGRFLAGRQRYAEAATILERAVELVPQAAWYNDLALVYRALARHDRERHAYEAALRLDRNLPDIWNNLGGLCLQESRADEAIAHFKNALALHPRFVEAFTNCGLAHLMRQDYEAAITCYRHALQLSPDLFKAWYQIGIACAQLGRWEAARQAFSRAVQLAPNDPSALNNLGNACKFTDRYDEAIAAYRESLRIRPDSADTWSNLGGVQQLAARHDAWRECLQHARTLAPHDPIIHGNFLNGMLFDPAQTAASIAAEHARHANLYPAPPHNDFTPRYGDPAPVRPLRVGFVSPDFCDHVVGRNILPLFRDRDRAAFHYTCYSSVPAPDALTEQFRSHADAWVDLRPFSDDAAAEKIHADGIDILIDLTLHMAGNRLGVFARKPAPVQVTFAGYPGSTGLPAIDFRLTDPYLDPPARGIGVPPMSSAEGTSPSITSSPGASSGLPIAPSAGDKRASSSIPAAHEHRHDADATDALYVERSIRLPHSFWCYDPLGLVVPVNEPPRAAAGVVTFGCLNNFCKTNDLVLGLWARVLARVPQSQLLLLARPGSHRQHVLDVLGAAGITAKRITFVPPRPRREYLAYFHRVDLSLDTVPYNGHTTSLDSLWMGVPVVTLVGETVVGRAGLSQLSNLGMPELIARTAEEYVEIACALAGDAGRLAEYRRTLRGRMEASVLMDAKRWVRGVEAALRGMWRT